MNIHDRFEKQHDHYLKFDKVVNKLSKRPDLHALMLLDKLFPSYGDIIIDASHDLIFLAMTEEQIESLNDHHIIELTQCGVRYNEDYGCLEMFT